MVAVTILIDVVRQADRSFREIQSSWDFLGSRFLIVWWRRSSSRHCIGEWADNDEEDKIHSWEVPCTIKKTCPPRYKDINNVVDGWMDEKEGEREQVVDFGITVSSFFLSFPVLLEDKK